MKEEPRVQVLVIDGGLVVASMETNVSGGRHEFTFSHPIRIDGRLFTGFALEMHLDQETRRVTYTRDLIALRPGLDLKR